MLTVGDKFPAFTLQGINSNNDFVEVGIRDDEQPMPWQVIYFYPKDFTFICPTEIAGMDALTNDANVIGISGDNEFCKLAWKKDNELIGNITHTLAADCGLGLSNAFRSFFIFLFDPLPNSMIEAFEGRLFLKEYFCFSIISSSVLFG